MELFFDGKVIPVFNEKIIAEYSDVLFRKKKSFRFSESPAKTMIDAIKENGMEFSGIATEEIPSDPKDVVFYEVVMDARKTENAFLVTGNIKDFPVKPFVVTPKEFLEIVKEKIT